MLHVTEMEKVIFFDFVNIKPIGLNAVMGHNKD